MKIQPMITRASLCLLAWCALAVAPTCAQTITHVPLTFNGDSDGMANIAVGELGDRFGSTVSGAGDVNGDGFDDLIVGASGDDNNGLESGSVRVFSGVDGSVLYNVDGDSAGNRFGGVVSDAGDVNGDGVADLIVGAGLDSTNGTFRGSARVLSGVDGSVLHDFEGDTVGDLFGTSVSGAGDVNGDGFADLIVGALFDDNNGFNSGSARVFSGVDGSVLYTFDGDSAEDNFGGSVSGAGDVNGDGFADLIVGASSLAVSPGDFDFARVFSGVDGSVLYTFAGASLDNGFGGSVSGAGDVNGDGFADLVVGASLDDNNGTDSGSVRVFSGVDGSVLYDFAGDSAEDRFGSSVSGAGDVNDDGFADLIVGAIDDDNNGTDSGSVRVFSGVDGSVLYNFDGDSAEDNFSRVSGAGDVNGDGVDDFIVGALGFGGANNGRYARVFVSQVTPSVLKGDVNISGNVDFFDIAPFIAVLSSGSFQAEADVNCDGEVNFFDISALITVLMTP